MNPYYKKKGVMPVLRADDRIPKIPCEPCVPRPLQRSGRMSTILIIDDDPRFRSQARDVLEADGFVVIGQRATPA